MKPNIIEAHLKFLILFRYLNSKNILTKKHKTPIQYKTGQEAKKALFFLGRKTIREMAKRYGFKTKTKRTSMIIELDIKQMGKFRACTERKPFKILSKNWGYWRESFSIYFIDENLIYYNEDIEEYFDSIYKDIENLASYTDSKVIETKKKPKKKKPKESDQNIFDNILSRIENEK